LDRFTRGYLKTRVSGVFYGGCAAAKHPYPVKVSPRMQTIDNEHKPPPAIPEAVLA
jgi:hypothetical protein